MLLVRIYRSACYAVYTYHTIVSLSSVPSTRPMGNLLRIRPRPPQSLSDSNKMNPLLSSYGMCYHYSAKDTYHSKILASALIPPPRQCMSRYMRHSTLETLSHWSAMGLRPRGYGIIHQILDDSESSEYRVDVVRYATPSHSSQLKKTVFVDSPAIYELRGQEVVYRANLSTMRFLELSAKGDDGDVTPFRCDGRVEAPTERVQNTRTSPAELAVGFEVASSTTSHWFKANASH